MILYDPVLATRFSDYGIMLPISASRAERVLEYLDGNFVRGTRGDNIPYPGPVFDFASALSYLEEQGNRDLVTRADLDRIHHGDFIAALFEDGPEPQSRADGSAPQSRTAGPTAKVPEISGPELSGLEKALLHAYELIDSQGRPCRYEPKRALKPLTALFQTILAQVGGTYLACRLALAPGAGFCYYLGGGMHHARYDCGSGFCLVNDIAVAIRKIQAEGRARLVWIIDLDAHKGDGTAELVRFARERGELALPPRSTGNGGPAAAAPGILTLSVHMARGWPLDGESLARAEKGRAPLVPSDIDIGVDRGEEARYVPRLAEGIAELEAMSGNEKPDLVLVVDGADPYEHDGLPSSALLKLSLEQCLERDNFVYCYVIDRNIPSAWIQAGGYGERAWEPSAHFLRDIR
jgi:acetoin utilization deacetylase AcuC-like enzyme